MKVSIITVSYNSEKFLAQCIKSVIEQDYDNIEYILIDGKSIDNTQEIIRSYSNHIYKWLSEPDEGIYDAINKGIQLASGEIVGILNSDDFFADNNVVSRMVSEFQSSNSEIIFADVDYVSEHSNRTIRHYSSKFFRPWMFRFGFMPAHPTFYTYRSNFLKYGFYRTDMRISGDFELLLRFMVLHRLPFAYIKDTWVKMRTGGVSSSGIKSVLKLNAEIVKAFRLNKMYTNYVFVFSKYMFKWWSFIRR
jgi:glycosyltransferase involved in cell wall biosynthesis